MARTQPKPPRGANGEDIAERKYTFEDMHRVLFSNKPQQPKTLEELKQAIADHLRKKHARR
ncbi:MAG TPA: hypothetical protein VEO54_11185 [Thermoanaerobaculia bacterium]|nr:hypothetical protein [Thermoanaerobaculia bacterium]